MAGSARHRRADVAFTSRLARVSSSLYYLICLTAALLVIAAASAAIVWRLQTRTLREAKAMELLDALARSVEWAEAQGRALRFQGPTQESDPALHDIGVLQARWFPELTESAEALFECELRMARLLRAQQHQRLQDPEALLESGVDAAFMELRREHDRAVQAMEDQFARSRGAAGAQPQFTSPS